MWSLLIPAVTLSYCLTAVCRTALAIVRESLRDTPPSDRPAILASLARVLRAWAEALCFWRRR